MRYLALALALLLSGCATTGVEMSADEAKACAAESCSVWTPAELTRLVQRAFAAGFQRGAQSTGRAL